MILNIRRFSLVLLAATIPASCSRDEFDATTWRNTAPSTEQGSTNPRQDMARQLESESTLIGMTREEIIALLRKPKHYDDPYFADEQSENLYYLVGPSRGFQLSHEFFLVAFDEDGLCRAARAYFH